MCLHRLLSFALGFGEKLARKLMMSLGCDSNLCKSQQSTVSPSPPQGIVERDFFRFWFAAGTGCVA